jgi:hypothetical protein
MFAENRYRYGPEVADILTALTDKLPSAQTR